MSAPKVLKPFDLDSYCDGLAKAGSEHAEQRAFIGWCLKARQLGTYEWAHKVYAIPNGGKRDAITAARLKTEGVRPGVPDLHYPVSRGIYVTLYIEMKADKGSLSEAQKDEHADLRMLSHAVATCWSWRGARQALMDYEDRVPVKEEYE